MPKPLENEFLFYVKHQSELVGKYEGKCIAIKNGVVLGAYNSELEAIRETAKTEEVGTFLVQKCEPGVDSYTQTYHSRVSFT